MGIVSPFRVEDRLFATQCNKDDVSPGTDVRQIFLQPIIKGESTLSSKSLSCDRNTLHAASSWPLCHLRDLKRTNINGKLRLPLEAWVVKSFVCDPRDLCLTPRRGSWLVGWNRNPQSRPQNGRWVVGKWVRLRLCLQMLPVSHVTSWAPPPVRSAVALASTGAWTLTLKSRQNILRWPQTGNKAHSNTVCLNHPGTIPSPPQPWSMEELSSMKPVPGAKNVGSCWGKTSVPSQFLTKIKKNGNKQSELFQTAWLWRRKGKAELVALMEENLSMYKYWWGASRGKDWRYMRQRGNGKGVLPYFFIPNKRE